MLVALPTIENRERERERERRQTDRQTDRQSNRENERQRERERERVMLTTGTACEEVLLNLLN